MKPPPDHLKARLLSLSPTLLADGGVPRFEEVADLVGVSRATLYYYFSGQDDLLSFLLEAHVEAGAEAIARADPGDDHPAPQRLQAVMLAAVDYLAARPGVCAGLLAAAASREQLREVLARNDDLIATPIRALLVAGREAGEFDVDDPHDATNTMLGGTLLTVLARDASQRDPTDPDFAGSLVDQLMNGLVAR